jgi:putative mRNA 3-end processing factor
MAVRGMRRRRAIDRGFILSDHSDWPGLLSGIADCGADRVLVTHGYVPMMVNYLREIGMDAEALATRFEGEMHEASETEAAEAPAEE